MISAWLSTRGTSPGRQEGKVTAPRPPPGAHCPTVVFVHSSTISRFPNSEFLIFHTTKAQDFYQWQREGVVFLGPRTWVTPKNGKHRKPVWGCWSQRRHTAPAQGASKVQRQGERPGLLPSFCPPASPQGLPLAEPGDMRAGDMLLEESVPWEYPPEWKRRADPGAGGPTPTT